jgi:hypothetical protein
MLALKDQCVQPATKTPYVKMALGGKENSVEGLAVSIDSSSIPAAYLYCTVNLIFLGRDHTCVRRGI